jgi:DNA (cytosine-5)-methyltransferase 1
MGNPSRSRAVDLFCGAGGMSLGFEEAGFDIVAAVEQDQIHARTHQQNFPECHTLACDISELRGDDICEAAGIVSDEIDVLIGGPPCQGFSSMGKRQKDDPRNLLLFEFARIIEELKPRYWVMENVEGLMIGTARSIMWSFLRRVRKAGYAVVEPLQVLNATEYGVPQRRKRVFILGYKPSSSTPSYPTRAALTTAKNEISCPTVWDAISDLHLLDDCDELLREDTYNGELEVGTQYSKILRGEVGDPHDHSLRRNSKCRVLTGCRRSAHTKKTIDRFKRTKPGSYEPISWFYRLTKDGVSNVLRAGTGKSYGGYTAPRPIHPVTPRCITVREAARLHSFPDWFQFDSTIWHGFQQVGNSVPPFLARAVGIFVKKAINRNRRLSWY